MSSTKLTAISAMWLLWLLLLALPASAQRAGKGENESAAFVAEARVAIRKSKLADAARSLDQAIVLAPKNLDAFLLRGAVHQSLR